jgi:hypothetical protein
MASPETIEAAHRSLVRRYHPDVSAGDPAATARAKRLNVARDWLLDPRRRAEYDRTRSSAAGGRVRAQASAQRPRHSASAAGTRASAPPPPRRPTPGRKPAAAPPPAPPPTATGPDRRLRLVVAALAVAAVAIWGSLASGLAGRPSAVGATQAAAAGAPSPTQRWPVRVTRPPLPTARPTPKPAATRAPRPSPTPTLEIGESARIGLVDATIRLESARLVRIDGYEPRPGSQFVEVSISARTGSLHL